MTEAYIIDGIRTPFGRRNGILKNIRPDDLAAVTLQHLVSRTHTDPATVEDVRLGCVTQVGEQGFNIGRLAPLIAGFPVEVPGATVNRMCASSLETVNQAAQAIKSDTHDLVIAAGVESMTRVPMGSDGSTFSNQLLAQYQIVPQGISAELIAEKWHLDREALDAYSYQSHMRAIAAQHDHYFDKETFDLTVPGDDGEMHTVRTDEGPRADTNLEKMATLRPAFKPDGVVTAGNSSQISDGASALLLASENAINRYGYTPRARIVAMSVVGVDPVIMLTGPIPATRKVLDKAGLKFDDIDVFEVNEAFASVVLAWGEEYHPDWNKVNPHGGAIAIGHPLGASGGRLVLTALNHLEVTNGRYALITMCIGWGMAVATIIERV
ncbi:thiolase family protein [Sulfobacillus thermosulfidooxidans]|uniref:thiolase family protein n=1 Tax=Sulfobacillus thermosulfidooxidans TaxID=28034 RepID=UPI00096B9977|nr:thiolase family protein [Sulfobacillus thermosulfidooxidans]OLZ09533.1 acetyl-CoA acetyltransferase [Sulfobacillus thermosulfidooxidans]OLZ16161.1 acetyl-CoA acetyltransferase [Sulfobacillus thermosulfidooxidans]OLZ17991.1 acetyl-CoA acetyltransferase [Sulfobacillus thermosulfidooxidans]